MNATRLTVIERSISAAELQAVLDRSQLVALANESLTSIDDRFLTRWLRRRATGIVIGRSLLSSHALAVALSADYLALHEESELHFGAGAGGESAAALFWRMGRSAIPLLAAGRALPAREAVAARCADILVPSALDSVKWLRDWLDGRSLAALHSGASLTRLGRSDQLERIEFARLFSTGEPQSALASFLRKVPPDFSSRNIVEIV